MNQYETNAMKQKMVEAGYRIVEENADIYIINTCTVTNMADRKSRNMIKRAKKEIKARYTAPFKFIKQLGGGVLMVGMSLPVAVANPGAGLGMFTKGTAGILNMANQKDDKGKKYKGAKGVLQAVTLGGYGTRKTLVKGKEKVGATVSYLKQASIKEDEIERIFSERFDKVSDEAMRRYKKEVKFYIKFASQDNLNMILRQGLAGKGVIDINDGNIDSVINDMTKEIFDKLGIEKQYSQSMANKIRARMMKEAKSLYTTKKADVENAEFGALDIAEAFSGAIKNEGISDEVNSEFMQSSMSKVLDTGKIEKIDSSNVGEVVNRFTDSVVKDLNLASRSNNSEIENNIHNETIKVANDIASRYGSLGFGEQEIKQEITDRVQEIVRKEGEKAGIDFGYDSITKEIEELHNINLNAEKKIKTSVVKENKFIDSLQKINNIQ